MSGSPRRRRARREEDISGQFRVTVPYVGELDQLRTRGGVYRRGCIPPGTEMMPHPREPGPCLPLHMNPPWSRWTRMMLGDERSQNTILLVSTQAVYKALHSTVRGHAHSHTRLAHTRSSSSKKSQSIRLEHSTVEPVVESCSYASTINASKDIQCIHCVQM